MRLHQLEFQEKQREEKRKTSLDALRLTILNDNVKQFALWKQDDSSKWDYASGKAKWLASVPTMTVTQLKEFDKIVKFLEN